jgi:zinc/manganese transport system permease protein
VDPVQPGLSWNLVADVQQMLSYHFMLDALRAGTVVAVVAGAIGYFMVLRRQSFAGHTLAVAGFPGAAAATWLGVNAAFGYFGFCIAGALAIAVLPGGGRARGATAASGGAGGAGEESAVVGTVQALALASGFLFVSLYHGFSSGLTAMLFGTITGVTDQQVLLLLACGLVCLGVLALLVRPLLFASVDADVAQARGVPVRLVDTAFLLLLGLAAAGTSQVTGSLLVFALLVAPAAAASRLTARPVAGVLLSVLLALAFVWVGEAIAFFSLYPIGFWVTTLAFGTFVACTAYRALADRLGNRSDPRRQRRPHRQPAPA